MLKKVKQKTGKAIRTATAGPRQGAESLRDLYHYVVPCPTGRHETFIEACQRLGVDEQRLQGVISGLKMQKRCCYLSLPIFVISYFIGLFYLKFSGFKDLAALNMVIIGAGVSTILLIKIFEKSHRLWQCEIRELKGLTEFFNDNGLLRIFRWN